ncbi:MAG: hypothetical protein EBV83_03525 [Verrucomicrobia bacterium]|nr:hypothetical protein [Verrucomicrobiota bacterium]
MKDMMESKKPGMFEAGNLSEVLGEEVPTLPLTRVGKFRLQQMLRRKFGAGWRNVSQAKSILDRFEVAMKRGE